MDLLHQLQLKKYCPNIFDDQFQKTSDRTPKYNCIAWVLGMQDRWIDPLPPYGTFWPADLPRDYSLLTFQRLFAAFGFTECTSADYEEGWLKIVIWADERGDFAHTAKVIGPNVLSSKLGEYEDVSHSLSGMADSSYGDVALKMKRPLQDP